MGFQGKLKEKKMREITEKQNLIMRRKQVLEQEKKRSHDQSRGYRQHIVATKFVKSNHTRTELSLKKGVEEDKLIQEYQMALIATGEAHRQAAENVKAQQLHKLASSMLERERHQQILSRSQHAGMLRRNELAELAKHDEKIQQLKKTKDEFRLSEREDAHAAGESYAVRQKIEESRRSWKAYHAQGPAVRRQTSVQQSALLVENRRKVPVDAKVIRHGMGPRDKSIVLNNAVAEEVVVQERTWDKVMRELLSNNKVLRRARNAQVKVKQANSVQFLDDELRLLEAADRSGVRMQRVRNGARISNPDNENSRLRDGFEEVFMSRHIDTDYAAAGENSHFGSLRDETKNSRHVSTSISSAPTQWVPAVREDSKPWHVAPVSSSAPRPQKEWAAEFHHADESLDVLFPPTVENYFDDSGSSSGHNSNLGGDRRDISEEVAFNSLSSSSPRQADVDSMCSPTRAQQAAPSSIRVDFTPPASARGVADHGTGVPDASWTNGSGDDAPIRQNFRGHLRSRESEGRWSGLETSQLSASTSDGSASTHQARHDLSKSRSPQSFVHVTRSVSSAESVQSLRESSATLSSRDSLEAPTITHGHFPDTATLDTHSFSLASHSPSGRSVGSATDSLQSQTGRLSTPHGERSSLRSSDSSRSSSSGSSDQASLYVEYQHLMGASFDPVRLSVSEVSVPSVSVQSVTGSSVRSSWESDAMPVISSVRLVASQQQHTYSSSSSSDSSKGINNNSFQHNSSARSVWIDERSSTGPSQLVSVADSVDGSVSVASGDTDTLFRQWDELYRSSQAITQSRASSATKSTPSSTFTRESSNSSDRRFSRGDLHSAMEQDSVSYIERHAVQSVGNGVHARSSPVLPSRGAPLAVDGERYEEGRAEAILRELDALSVQWSNRQVVDSQSSHVIKNTHSFHSGDRRSDRSMSESSSSVSLSRQSNVDSGEEADSPLIYSLTQMRQEQQITHATVTKYDQNFHYLAAFGGHRSDSLRRSVDSMSTLSSPATSVVLTAIVALPPGVEPPSSARQSALPLRAPSALSPQQTARSALSSSASFASSVTSSSRRSHMEERQDSVLFSEQDKEDVEQRTPSTIQSGRHGDYSGDEIGEVSDTLHALRRTTATSTPLTAYSLRSDGGNRMDATPGSSQFNISSRFQSPHSASAGGISIVSAQSLSVEQSSRGAISRSLNGTAQHWDISSGAVYRREVDEEEEEESDMGDNDSQLSEQSLDSLMEYRRATSSYI